MSKNVTIALEEGLLEKARDYAQGQGISLNALIRQVLAERVESPASHGPEQLFRSMDAAKPQSMRRKWSREELYDRPILRK